MPYRRHLIELEKKPGTALVLSGGATKAFYFHLGVLKVLKLDDVSSIVGTSAGAIIGAFIASGATVDEILASVYQRKVYMPRFDSWVRRFTSTSLFKPKYQDISLQSLMTGVATVRFLLNLPMMMLNRERDMIAEAMDAFLDSQSQARGFFDAGALEDLLKKLLPSSDFADTMIDLYVTATALDNHRRAIFNGNYDFDDGENTFARDVPMHKAVRASSAIPAMFEPVKINGKYYVDGEVKQTLSADIGAALADRVVVCHTYQPLMLGDNQTVNDMGWWNITKQSLFIAFQQRISVWQKIYEDQYPDKEIIWIQPDPEDVQFFQASEFSFQPEVQKMMIKRGEEAALKVLSKRSLTRQAQASLGVTV